MSLTVPRKTSLSQEWRGRKIRSRVFGPFGVEGDFLEDILDFYFILMYRHHLSFLDGEEEGEGRGRVRKGGEGWEGVGKGGEGRDGGLGVLESLSTTRSVVWYVIVA